MPMAEETVVNVNLQPLRVNIDQETLFFIIDFCSAFLPKNEPSIPLTTDSGKFQKEYLGKPEGYFDFFKIAT